MSHAGFVHLHVHTAYTLSQGAIHVKDLVKQCVGHKMPAVAVTDTDNMFSALEFSTSATEAGVQPIIGVSLHIRNPYQVTDPKSKKYIEPDQIVLLAQTELGYQNLMKLVSRAHLESDVAEGVQLPFDAFEGFSDGIICLTGGVSGPVGSLLLAGQNDKAEECLVELNKYFGGRLYVEIQRHNLEDERRTEETFLDLAYKQDLPIVATNQPYFTSVDMYQAHDTLLCIADGTYVAENDRRKLNKDYRFKSAEEMIKLFSDLPEAIENARKIAKRCA